MRVLDFDRINEWWEWIDEALETCISPRHRERFVKSDPDKVIDLLRGSFDPVITTRAFLDNFKNDFVRLYHASRVTENDLESIKSIGLRTLKMEDRKKSLSPLLKKYQDWGVIKNKFEEFLKSYQSDPFFTPREDNSVHFAISRNCLIKDVGCSHYLYYGGEVDGHIVKELYPDDPAALNFVRNNRFPILVSIVFPFKDALEMANPSGTDRRYLPALIELFLEAWAIKVSNPEIHSVDDDFCSSCIFRGSIPFSEIEGIERVIDSEITEKPY